MIKELFQDRNINTNKLIEIAKSNFTVELKKIFYLKAIIFHDSFNNDVLKVLVQNLSAPLNKLDPPILRGIARLEIETIETLLLAIKRLRDNEYFMSAIKDNKHCYSKFLEKQKAAVESFNEALTKQVKELEEANTVETIQNINSKKTQLEQQRQELLEQYPEAQPLTISEFINNITTVTNRIIQAQAERNLLVEAEHEHQQRKQQQGYFPSVCYNREGDPPRPTTTYIATMPAATLNRNPRSRYNY